jgi:hypothetical protein
MNNNIKTIISLGAIGFALAGCGASPNQSVPNQVAISSNTLQFAVGTANLYGTATALNVVATYRQPNGDSGTLVNSPTISLPAAIPGALSANAGMAGFDACSTAATAPAAGETTAITSTSQAPFSTAVTSFGQSGGVFGIGIEPYNATGQGDCTPAGTSSTGTPFQVAPYPVPLYDTASPSYAAGADPNVFVPWGGPPDFLLTGSSSSVVGNGNYPAGTAGVGEGIDVFAGIAPVAGGSYTLSLSIPTTTAGTSTPSKSATMPAALKILGLAAAPAYVPDVAGDGGGTFPTFAMPALATQAYLQITDYGPATAGAASCNGSGTTSNATVGNMVGNPVYYTRFATATGSLTLPPLVGPGGTPSVCTAAQNTATNGAATPADTIAIQVIGFDYDLYHASYPASLGVAAPAQINAQTSDDLTISPAICQVGAAVCPAGTLGPIKAQLASLRRKR